MRSIGDGPGLLILMIAGLFCAGPLMSYAQVSVDTVQGLVGKEVALPFLYDDTEEITAGTELTFAASFKLENPTVFFPQVFRGGSGIGIVEQILDNSTDSTYSFVVRLRVVAPVVSGDTLVVLAGEALAGSDTTSLIFFSDMTFDGRNVPDVNGRVVTSSIGPSSPYIRFATLDPGRPNPTQPGRTVSWGFRIDKQSEVTFKIYDLIGQEVSVQDLGELDLGVYVYTFTPDAFFPSGMFIVRMITNTGEAYEIMHVLR